MIVEVEPVKIGDGYFISVTIDGTAMERHGPLPDADAAEIVAERMRRVGRALSGGKHG
jgi:hypothetical protein